MTISRFSGILYAFWYENDDLYLAIRTSIYGILTFAIILFSIVVIRLRKHLKYINNRPTDPSTPQFIIQRQPPPAYATAPIIVQQETEYVPYVINHQNPYANLQQSINPYGQRPPEYNPEFTAPPPYNPQYSTTQSQSAFNFDLDRNTNEKY